MSASNEEETGETPVKRTSLNKRAYRIRRLPEDKRTKEQQDWLEEYDRTKRQAGPREEPAPETTEAPEPTEAPDEVIPVVPPPPPPPRVDTNFRTGKERDDEPERSSDWRKKYERGKGTAGRETTVLFVAGQYMQFLKWMEAQIVFSGGQPMIPPDEIFNALVITVDDYLPRDVTLKPAHVVVACTTSLVIQRVIRRKKIAEAFENAKRDGVEPPRPPEPPPPPTPPPPGPDLVPVPAPVLEPDILLRPIQIPVDLATAYVPGPSDVV